MLSVRVMTYASPSPTVPVRTPALPPPEDDDGDDPLVDALLDDGTGPLAGGLLLLPQAATKKRSATATITTGLLDTLRSPTRMESPCLAVPSLQSRIIVSSERCGTTYPSIRTR